ncbi:MAG: hypothetical protein IJC02_14405 [Lachnospiraceae bacterium]|nr:hypothetical protein [Lachnospiraceae bacterium]
MAMNTKKKSCPVWVKLGAIAACLCLMVGLAIPMLNDYSDEDSHSGLKRVKNPVYDVVEYTAPAGYEPAELYISTTTDLVEYDTYMAERNGEKFRGKGVRVFTFVEGATTKDFNVWYFDSDGTSISRIYFATKSGDKFVTAWTEPGELGKAIESLASKTSADNPMYLAQDNEILYAVIGKTAYYLPDTAMKPEVSQMPAINTEGLDISTITLFHDKILNKSDLSAGTLEWLEKYNKLSKEEQLSISSIPNDLYKLLGYENATEEVAPADIEPLDYPPMVMFNNILYTAANYSGDKENLSVVGKIESCVDYGIPTENNQANDSLLGCEIYTTSSTSEFIFVLNNDVYSPYKANIIERTKEPNEYPPTNIVPGFDLDEPSEIESVKYLDKTLNKSDLSAETLEWLEWFNGLSETGQLSVSFVPKDILELCGYVATNNSEIGGPTD